MDPVSRPEERQPVAVKVYVELTGLTARSALTELIAETLDELGTTASKDDMAAAVADRLIRGGVVTARWDR